MAMAAIRKEHVPMKITGVSFSLFSEEEIKEESVVRITETSIYQKNVPREGGVADHRMGTVDRNIACGTCKQDVEHCNGHFGHIDLPIPCYSSFYLVQTLKILRSVCFFCSRLLIPSHIVDKEGKRRPNPKLVYIQRHYTHQMRFQMMTKLAKGKPCPYCAALQPTYTKWISGKSFGIQIEWSAESQKQWEPPTEEDIPDEKERFHETIRRTEEKTMATKIFTSIDAYNILKHIQPQDVALFGMDPTQMHPKRFMITVLKVPPPVIRPSVVASEGSRSRGQNDLTRKLLEIMKQIQIFHKIIQEHPHVLEKSEPLPKELQYAMTELQYHIATYMSNPIRGLKPSTTRSGAQLKGLQQRIKGKGGRIRGNLTGKRVDFSSRTVVSPDPNLEIDQVGIPKRIATILTIEERVTPFNMAKLQQRVLVGAKNVGGAHTVIPKTGPTIYLEFCQIEKRRQIRLEYGWIVERYLQDGDYVIFNRQPSLHKKSLMAHRVKIMPVGDTFRLNLSVCSPYNADFDGDEMNIHAVQLLEGRAELQELMAIDKQVLNAQTNKPTFGLVQDALTGTYKMTRKDTFLDRGQVMNLMMAAEKTMNLYNPKWELPPPCIWKPEPLWSGKQVYSLLFPCFNLSKIVRNAVEDDPMDVHERMVIIQRGELLCGALCKQTVGAVTGGIVHIITKDHGMSQACMFLSDAQKLVNRWLGSHGFTVGISDCVASDSVESHVREIIKHAYRRIDRINQEVEMESKQGTYRVTKQDIEEPVASILRDVINQTGRLAQSQMSDKNHIYVMTTAGSKGNPINLSQIMACVGQQTVDGRRIHVRNSLNQRTTLFTRTMTCYEPGQEHPETHGFCPNSYAIGLEPEEMYMHAMGGREGLVDTAVKTANTGYIQRRLLKAMEALKVNFDGTVRNAEGYIVDFLYGGDGIDAQWLEPCSLFLLQLDNAQVEKQFRLRHFSTKADSHWKRAVECEMKDLYRLRDECRRRNQNWVTGEVDKTALLPIHIPRMMQTMWESNYSSRLSSPQFSSFSFTLLTPTERQTLLDQFIRKMAKRFGNSHEAVLVLETVLKSYACSTKICVKENHWTREMLRRLLDQFEEAYEKCAVCDGEMVGALASESIGEPSTQLSFHKDTLVYYTENGCAKLETMEKWFIRKWSECREQEQLYFPDSQTSMVIHFHNQQTCIASTDDEGQVKFLPVSAWTKHPANGALVKVRTASGRTVIATLAKSFLVYQHDTNSLQPVNGSDLQIGDCLPVSFTLPHVWSIRTHIVFQGHRIALSRELGTWLSLIILDQKPPRTPIFLECNVDEFVTFHCCTQTVPEWMLEAPHECVQGFLSGFGIQAGKAWKWNTTCERSRHCMSVLCMRVGIMCHWCSEPGGRILLMSNDDNDNDDGDMSNDDDDDMCNNDNEKENKKEKKKENHTFGNIILDPITDLELIQVDQDEFVYDITVPGTFNFMLANGMHVRDTLNTFHLSGVGNKNVSMGVPRLRELIDVTKSDKMKTPSLTIALEPQYATNKEAAMRFAQSLIHTTLGDVIQTSSTIHEPNPLETVVDSDREMVRIANLFRNHARLQTPSRWVIRWVLNRAHTLKRGLYPVDIANILREYVNDRGDVVYSPANTHEWVVRLTLFDIGLIVKHALKRTPDDETKALELERIITQTEMNRLESAVVLGGIEGIQDASLRQFKRTVIDPATGGLIHHQEWAIDTRGTAMLQVWAMDGVDWTRTISNDLYEIYENLGIEAVGRVLFQEIKNVLSDSYVNDRHITTVVRTMCFRGYLMPMSRHGINRVDTGVLMRVSFEESMDQLMNAAMFNEVDDLKGITENMMIGVKAPMGTGTVHVHMPEWYQEYMRNTVYGRPREIVRHQRIFKSMITEWNQGGIAGGGGGGGDDLDQWERPPSPLLYHSHSQSCTDATDAMEVPQTFPTTSGFVPLIPLALLQSQDQQQQEQGQIKKPYRPSSPMLDDDTQDSLMTTTRMLSSPIHSHQLYHQNYHHQQAKESYRPSSPILDEDKLNPSDVKENVFQQPFTMLDQTTSTEFNPFSTLSAHDIIPISNWSIPPPDLFLPSIPSTTTSTTTTTPSQPILDSSSSSPAPPTITAAQVCDLLNALAPVLQQQQQPQPQ